MDDKPPPEVHPQGPYVPGQGEYPLTEQPQVHGPPVGQPLINYPQGTSPPHGVHHQQVSNPPEYLPLNKDHVDRSPGWSVYVYIWTN